jgi:nucleoside-diphosphate-sugar epimerase
VIALLGATGYIGRSVARRLALGTEPVVLFARDPSRLANEAWPAHVSLDLVTNFEGSNFDLIVNAIGASDPARLAQMGAEILDITQTWDERVLTTMRVDTRYVFLSSGAIYGEFNEPVHETSKLCLPVNRLGSVSPYTISKLYAEARHRHLPTRAILDIRIFAYADPSISLKSRFFLAELARSVSERKAFVTSQTDLTRDYTGAQELAELIQCWLAVGAPNAAVDLYSKEAVTKFDLLAAVERRFGIDIRVEPRDSPSPTGPKPIYVSNYRAAAAFGYAPTRTSLEIVLEALGKLNGGTPE